MAASCPGGQLTRGQFAAVSCPCSLYIPLEVCEFPQIAKLTYLAYCTTKIRGVTIHF